MAEASENSWRNVIAALANPHTRRLYATLLLGLDDSAVLDSHSPSRRRHVVESLLRTGTVTEGADGRLSIREDAFGEILAQQPARRRTGVERFLVRGRIGQYPSSVGEREELLRWVAGRVLAADEILDERSLTERLADYTDDPATLRRYLVDFSIVERRRDGSEYCLVSVGGGEG
ncbi:MAG: DUF2087 domain-containing protein [Microbacterium sp.]|uniref:DUF2087 domain-containing protein n=1 Tax=Microbacterium sp. TaxID=51671 RepID=UPI001AC9D448|nr:DUF2087 domain-containing protein [Microbacterium sp.]MBN9153944.1 DUF2087 domain-containing protein [Microbacterium sp.]MBN9171249.1 DUF2087 domain-containing protein [Microbacterium sp.]